VVATAHVNSEFIKRGYKLATAMSTSDIGCRLVDPEWMGVDGNGAPDTVIFMGIPYYFVKDILSGLKNFALN
jgi:CO dehydrogenase/acetyl-CoA synthase epsilon subunit